VSAPARASATAALPVPVQAVQRLPSPTGSGGRVVALASEIMIRT
jgi:hypothetical protein